VPQNAVRGIMLRADLAVAAACRHAELLEEAKAHIAWGNRPAVE
jgi:hypothetical protein